MFFVFQLYVHLDVSTAAFVLVLTAVHACQRTLGSHVKYVSVVLIYAQRDGTSSITRSVAEPG